MSVERINPESSADQAASSTRSETVVPFRIPLPKAAVVERTAEQKKSKHNRKRRKKEPAQTFAEQSREGKKSETLEVSKDRSAYTIWQRPEDSPQSRKSAEFGKQVLAGAEQLDDVKDRSVVVERPMGKRQNSPERPILDWLGQSSGQRQGNGETSGYEPVQPPPQPPDPLSYRRSFWKEQTVPLETAQGDKGSVLPPLHDYEQPMRPPERVSVAPFAAIEVFDRAINRSAVDRADIPRAAKVAAAKAAELAVMRISEAAASPSVGAERQLSKRELMRLSKEIRIDGVSIKEIYKAQRIDETGLRSVVEAYMRGGDVRRQLTEELTAKEQSYELDPVLRHQYLRGERPQQIGSGSRLGLGGGPGGMGGISQTVGRALGSVATTAEQAARSAGRAIASGAKTAQRDIIDNSNTADWLSVTAVVVLYSIILILLLT